jgi:polysaccharide biosynthesis transport protein
MGIETVRSDRERPDGGEQLTGEEREVDSLLGEVLRFGGILRTRIGPVCLTFVLAFAAVAALGLRQPKQYKATATVLVAPTSPNVLQDVSDVYSLGTRNPWEFPRYLETQTRIVRSREIAASVVDQLGLGQDEAFLGPAGAEDGDAGGQTARTRDPVAVLMGRLAVDKVEDSNLLLVVCKDFDADRASLIANSTADTYVAHNSSTRTVANSKAVRWLGLRAEELQTAVQQAEQDLLRFREVNTFMGASIEDAITINGQTISRLSSSLTDLELQRLTEESRWERLEGLRRNGSDRLLPELVEDPVIQAMKVDLVQTRQHRAEVTSRYGPLHPSVERLERPEIQLGELIDREIDEIIQARLLGIETLEANESAIRASLAGEQDRALELAGKSIEYNRLQQTLAQRHTLLHIIQDRTQEARLTEQLQVNNVSIVEYAQPPKSAFKPRLSLIGLLGLFVAAGLACGVAFVLDRLDATVHSQAQIEREFGLRVLGIQPIPRAIEALDRSRGRAGPDWPEGLEPKIELLTGLAPQSTFAECLRTIRTNLLFLTPDRPVQTLLVTSASPREGKTSFATNLALTIASAGHRTLLLDTDMRRPRLHEVFDLPRSQGQLARLIVGDADLSSAVVPSGFPNLDLLPCGPVPPNPVELLNSRQFAQLLDRLRDRYDRLILDSPPVMPVTDARVLGQYADAVLLVVRQMETNRHVLGHALRQLRDVDAPLVGGIFNGVDLDNPSYRYGYGGKYDYYYAQYEAYASSEAAEAPAGGAS